MTGRRRGLFASSFSPVLLRFQKSDFLSFSLFLLAACSVSTSTVAMAESTSGTSISDSELVTLLRGAKIVSAESRLTASISGDEVVVTTTRKPKMSDSECKIEAVLIAKTAFDSVSSDVQRSKIMFLDFDGDSYSEVAVKRAEVKMFGSGQLTEKELLASLELKTSKADVTADNSGLDVVAGPLQPERIIASGKLQLLQSRGTNVTPFRAIFAQVEEAAAAKNTTLTRKLLADLSGHIKEQEQLSASIYSRERALQAKYGSKGAPEIGAGSGTKSGSGSGKGIGAGRRFGKGFLSDSQWGAGFGGGLSSKFGTGTGSGSRDPRIESLLNMRAAHDTYNQTKKLDGCDLSKIKDDQQIESIFFMRRNVLFATETGADPNGYWAEYKKILSSISERGWAVNAPAIKALTTKLNPKATSGR